MRHYRGYFHSDDSITIYPEEEGGFGAAIGVGMVLLLLINLLSDLLLYMVLIFFAKREKNPGKGAMLLALGTAIYMVLLFAVNCFPAVFSENANYFGIFLTQFAGICFAIYSRRFAVKKEEWARAMEDLFEEPGKYRIDLCEKAKRISAITTWCAAAFFLVLIVCAVVVSA